MDAQVNKLKSVGSGIVYKLFYIFSLRCFQVQIKNVLKNRLMETYLVLMEK